MPPPHLNVASVRRLELDYMVLGLKCLKTKRRSISYSWKIPPQKEEGEAAGKHNFHINNKIGHKICIHAIFSFFFVTV